MANPEAIDSSDNYNLDYYVAAWLRGMGVAFIKRETINRGEVESYFLFNVLLNMANFL